MSGVEMAEQSIPGRETWPAPSEDEIVVPTPVEEAVRSRLGPDTRLDLMLGLHVPGVKVPSKLEGWNSHDWRRFFRSEREMNVAWNTRLNGAEQPAFRKPNPDVVPVGSPREQAERFLVELEVLRSAGPFATLAMIGRFVRTGGDLDELVQAAWQAAPLDQLELTKSHR
jgi:hypothetical protein